MKYRALWIDDDCKTTGRDFIGQAEQDDIDITAFESHEEGMAYLEKNLNYFHVVILDAKVKGQIADEQTGMAIVRRALEAPLRTLTANAGIDGSIVIQRIKEGKGDFGFNARTEEYENLFKAGVIDPTKVSRVALENAASIAGLLLTTECVVAEKPKKEEMPMGGAPDMGGMGY